LLQSNLQNITILKKCKYHTTALSISYLTTYMEYYNTKTKTSYGNQLSLSSSSSW